MVADVTFITPSLPGRSDLLARAIQCVADQSVLPKDHLIALDLHRSDKPAALRNKLVEKVDTEWVAFLDDDDELEPYHLAYLMAASQGADVVYPYSTIRGRNDISFNRPFDADVLRRGNYIPVTTLVKTETFRKVGGFPLDWEPEDWHLWLNILDAGGVFVNVPVRTWVYNFGTGDQRHTNDVMRREDT